jgi:hypothetical protein
MKVGVIMMSLALVIAGLVVRVILGSEPRRVVVLEGVATKFHSQAPRYSSGEEERP